MQILIELKQKTKQKYLQKGNLAIILCFQISNPGKALQTLGSAFLNIMWPSELANGKWLLYPASLKFEDQPETFCSPSEAINPLKLSSSAADQVVSGTLGSVSCSLTNACIKFFKS